jgi:hypothetical protein
MQNINRNDFSLQLIKFCSAAGFWKAASKNSDVKRKNYSKNLNQNSQCKY